MKKILFLLLLLVATARAQNPTLIFSTNGFKVYPANQHTGKLLVGFDAGNVNDVLTWNGTIWVAAAPPGSTGITNLTTTAPWLTASGTAQNGFINTNSTKIAINTFTDNNASGMTNFNSSLVVLTTGAQSVAGIKTFVNNLVITNGNLGIGVTVPLAHIDSETDGAADIIMSTAFGTGFNGNFIGRAARGTQAVPTASQSDDVLANYGGRGYGATGFAAASRSRIQFIAAEAWTDTAQGSYLTLTTTPTNGTTVAERMRITQDGIVLIGSTSKVDSEKLGVTGSIKINSGALLPAVAIVTNAPSGTITNNWALASEYQILLTNNCIPVPINYTNGQTMRYVFIQDSVGSRTVTLNFPHTFGTDITSFTATTTANKRDRVGLIGYVTATTNVADVVAVKKGF